MNFRFLTLTLVLVMALASVSVFADDAGNPLPPVPTVNGDGAGANPTVQPGSGAADTGVQGGAGVQNDNNGAQLNDIGPITDNTDSSQRTNANDSGSTTAAQSGDGAQGNGANNSTVNKESDKPKENSDSSKNKPLTPPQPADLLNAPVPQLNSAGEYLSYIQGNDAVMKKVIAAYTQGRDEKVIPAIKRDILKIFMDKNLEAANAGLNFNAKESDFLALAITKAEILVLKAKLYKDANADAQLNIFLGELENAGKDYTHKVVNGKVESLKSKIDAYHFRHSIHDIFQNNNADPNAKDEIKNKKIEIINKMNETLQKNSNNATPELAQNAILLMLYVQNDSDFNSKDKELLRSKYFELLSNATNPETKKVVQKAQDDIKNAIAAEAERQKKLKEERTKSRPNANNPNENK